MSSKVSASNKVSSPVDLRNVVLVGSAGSGKTTLFDTMLAARIPGHRPAKDDTDRAAALTLASVSTGDVVVNLLDAPGHPDFVGELRAGLRAADAAVFVVSAADGVDNATAALWAECKAVNMPRAIVITKLDAERGDYESAVQTCQATFGEGVVPAYLPLTNDAGEVIGSMSLVTERIHDYSSGTSELRDASDDESAQIETYRAPFLESVVTEAEDDDLMERYLEGEQLAVDQVRADLLKATAHATFFPAIPVQASNGVGVEELFSLIEHGLPHPALHPLPTITNADGSDILELTCDPDGPLVAEVIRTKSDPYAGRQSMVRIFSGTLRTDETVHVAGHRELFTGVADAHHPDHDEDEKVGPLAFPVGLEMNTKKEAIAGDIVLVGKLTRAETSDTLSAKESPALVEPWNQPEPLLPTALKAATRNDEDKLAGALARLVVEDTTIRLERTTETDQEILWTMGQAHTDLLLGRLNDRYGVKVTQEPVKVPMRETFIAGAKAHGRHVKQSGGHGQYAVCDIEIAPGERGSGFVFVDKVVGGAVPRQFIPSVEKGIKSQLERGTIYGYPMVDVQVTLYDGKAHSVDSSDMAFQSAGALALKEAATPQTVALLEPIDEVTVTVGEEYLGAVMTDLSNRRGQVLGTDADAEHHSILKALVPATELERYAVDLRGLAHGSGTFTRTFHGYELVPPQIAQTFEREA
ncbi:Translation elongation factor G-related protein [Luteococcus japonicus LSP_Lj1]|uniref:Translation elongation factor G-related protein n=1 Tax=Luteococcus japonicus LSP_Lj1 TaxID=1255658 RepID=A0A1R4KFM8_9ACTN|nr:Translation elongation factor G-related protein [Luteococcus japonicus LSP_Lj1]